MQTHFPARNSPLSWNLLFHLLLFSLSVVSDFSQPHEPQHARLPFHLCWSVCYWSQWCTCGRELELYGCACLDFMNTMTSFLGKIRLLSGLWLRRVFDKGRENLASELFEVWLSWMSLRWEVLFFKRGFLICSSLSNIFRNLSHSPVFIWLRQSPLIIIICLQIAFK